MALPLLWSTVAVCGFRDTTGILTSRQLVPDSQKASFCRLFGPKLAFYVPTGGCDQAIRVKPCFSPQCSDLTGEGK